VQGLFLADLADGAEAEAPASGDAWQDLIYRCGQRRGVSSRDTFAAVYATFLGRANGPRAGWLLASLDLGFVTRRLRQAAATLATTAGTTDGGAPKGTAGGAASPTSEAADGAAGLSEGGA
jgi:hypothetical protein